MSIATSFSSGKETLRRGAVALATVAALFSANAGHAASFTEQECKVIAGVSASTIRAVGPGTLSVDFRRSLRIFVAPDGKSATCNGPTDIATPTASDIDTFNTIRTILLAGPNPISLQNRGIRSVASLAMN